MSSNSIKAPVFTLLLPGTKLYIVTTVELIQAIQKQSKVLDFHPILVKFAARACGVSKRSHDIAMRNLDGGEDIGQHSLFRETNAETKKALSPGQCLDKMNQIMVQKIVESFSNIIPPDNNHSNLMLEKFIISSITSATTESIYGPDNPFKDSSVQDAFW